MESTIRKILDDLPRERFTDPMWREKVDRTYFWVRQRYDNQVTTAS